MGLFLHRIATVNRTAFNNFWKDDKPLQKGLDIL